MRLRLARTGLSSAWPAMMSGVARVEIKVIKKLHGGKDFDASKKLHHIYFGCKQGEKLTLFTGITKACAFNRTPI